jgi:hypothetical protein
MKTHFFRARMAGCLITALVLASCAADDAATDPITDTSQAPGSSVTVQDTAGGDDMAGMDEMEGADHDHEEGAVTEWEGAPPQLEIVVGDGLITLEDGAIPTSTSTADCSRWRTSGLSHFPTWVRGCTRSRSRSPLPITPTT